MGWVLVLFCLPVLGLICYYFFGQDNRKIKQITRKYSRRSMDLSSSLFVSSEVSDVPYTYQSLATLLKRNNNSSILYGSKVEIMTKGERKFEANFEINSYMYDRDVALQMKEIFFNDAKGCKEIILKEWNKRPWHKKIVESVMRLFSPLM